MKSYPRIYLFKNQVTSFKRGVLCCDAKNIQPQLCQHKLGKIYQCYQFGVNKERSKLIFKIVCKLF